MSYNDWYTNELCRRLREAGIKYTTKFRYYETFVWFEDNGEKYEVNVKRKYAYVYTGKWRDELLTKYEIR
jgi:hypothetical protein